MTLLTVWADQDPATVLRRTTDAAEIGDVLGELGVKFDRWPVRELPATPTEEQVLDAYRAEVDEVIRTEGYTFVDVKQLSPDDPGAAEARAKFLSEHTHDDDEDRFFARGSGVFYLHMAGKVHAVLCEAGDLLSVPAKTTHWFDMGTRPDYVSIRFFHDTDGWVGDFLEKSIADRFPPMDELTREGDSPLKTNSTPSP
ncbi:acireductone dioxygenase [Amycolatopsis sp. YIM 10]|uniref:1,2-dihydroxy-3-keto-5-methylthiopentene dioxygenase n=1 Tax=Amycolatopsis sp. YIM 10 TaxID=2653857 RepID=UPI00128FD692|nr:cupin [Amycolatopsis sp. YIM 10]QFU93733.1 Acireductone dioxygenase [Amycolatopsis sp. YIM 10]